MIRVSNVKSIFGHLIAFFFATCSFEFEESDIANSWMYIINRWTKVSLVSFWSCDMALSISETYVRRYVMIKYRIICIRDVCVYVVQRIRRAASTGAARSLPKNPKVKPTLSPDREMFRRFDVSPSVYYICDWRVYVHTYTRISIVHYFVNVPRSHWPLPSALLTVIKTRRFSRLHVPIKSKGKGGKRCASSCSKLGKIV